MNRYSYLTCCVHVADTDEETAGESIRAMVERARRVSFKTFARRCDWQGWAREHGYSIGGERGLHLRNDWHVSYHKSVFRGAPCYYVRWSAVENIFTDQERR
jgi:hypothetical protein